MKEFILKLSNYVEENVSYFTIYIYIYMCVCVMNDICLQPNIFHLLQCISVILEFLWGLKSQYVVLIYVFITK